MSSASPSSYYDFIDENHWFSVALLATVGVVVIAALLALVWRSKQVSRLNTKAEPTFLGIGDELSIPTSKMSHQPEQREKNSGFETPPGTDKLNFLVNFGADDRSQSGPDGASNEFKNSGHVSVTSEQPYAMFGQEWNSVVQTRRLKDDDEKSNSSYLRGTSEMICELEQQDDSKFKTPPGTKELNSLADWHRFYPGVNGAQRLRSKSDPVITPSKQGKEEMVDDTFGRSSSMDEVGGDGSNPPVVPLTAKNLRVITPERTKNSSDFDRSEGKENESELKFRPDIKEILTEEEQKKLDEELKSLGTF